MAGCGAGGRLEGLDMEVPSGGAAGRCASVWEGFLHRNRVLPLTLSTTPLCLQTRWFLNGSEEKKINSEVLASLLFVPCAFLHVELKSFHSHTSSDNLTSWPIN